MGYSERDPLGCRGGLPVRGRFDLQQRSSRAHLHVGNGHHLPDLARKRRDHLHFHLHGFEYSEAIAGCNHVARLYRDGNDYRRRGRAHHAAVVAINAVRHAIQFDAVAQALLNRDGMEATPESSEPVLERAQPLEVGINARPVDLYTVLLQSQAINLDGVRMVPIPQLNGVAHFAANLWPSAQC